MTLEMLQKDMISAMKAKDTDRKSVLTSAIGAIKNAAIAKQCRDNISEELVNEVLLKEKKTLQEQLDTCPTERVEKRAEFEKKLSIISEYCPKLLDNPSEIEQIISKLCAEASLGLSKTSRGPIMKVVMPYFKGKADMTVVNKVLSNLLK